MTINRPQDTDRRTILKTFAMDIVGAATMTESAVAHEPKGGGKGPVELTWGSDRGEWESLTGNFPNPSDGESHAPLYILAPVADSQETYLSHNVKTHENIEHGGVTPIPLDGVNEISVTRRGSSGRDSRYGHSRSTGLRYVGPIDQYTRDEQRCSGRRERRGR